jgi:hypothetical protein
MVIVDGAVVKFAKKGQSATHFGQRGQPQVLVDELIEGIAVASGTGVDDGADLSRIEGVLTSRLDLEVGWYGDDKS